MDRWKIKELKRMELGGNKNATEYYQANGMMKDGRPDHEAAPHARYKMELCVTMKAIPTQSYLENPKLIVELPINFGFSFSGQNLHKFHTNKNET
jgi:hypothetical protein